MTLQSSSVSLPPAHMEYGVWEYGVWGMIWEYGDMGYGNMEVWLYGSMGVWKYGDMVYGSMVIWCMEVW